MQRIVKIHLHHSRIVRIVTIAIVFSLAGWLALTPSRAATFATASEAESGTVAGNATSVADANTSGAAAVKFGNVSSGTSTYPQPGTVGYQGNNAALTVIDSTHPYTGSGGSAWNVQTGNEFSQTNLTLDHVWIKGSLYWSGTGTLTITNSIIEGGTGSYTIWVQSGATVNLSDSTLRWPTSPHFPTNSDNANLTGNVRFVQNITRCDFSGQPHGVELTASNSVLSSSYIHDLAYTASDPHLDGVFIFGGTNVQVLNNYIVLSGHTNNYVNSNDITMYGTAAVFLQNTFGYGIASPVIKGNYLHGGAASYYQEAGTGTDVEDNTIDVGYYGDINFSAPATIATWANNKHLDGSTIPHP